MASMPAMIAMSMSAPSYEMESKADQAGHDSQEEQGQWHGKHAEASEPGVVPGRRRYRESRELRQARDARPEEVSIETPAFGELCAELVCASGEHVVFVIARWQPVAFVTGGGTEDAFYL